MSASDKTIFNAIKAKKGNIYLLSLRMQKDYAAKTNPDYIFGFGEDGFWKGTTSENFANEVLLERVVSDFNRGISYGTLAPIVVADSVIDKIQNRMQQIQDEIRDLGLEQFRQSKQQKNVTQVQIERLAAELSALNDESTRLDEEREKAGQVESTPVTAYDLLEGELGLTSEQALSYAASIQQILLYYHRYLTKHMGEPKFSAAIYCENDKLIIELHTETDPELYSKFEILVSDLQVDAEGKPKVAPIRMVETYEIVKPGATPKIAKVDVTPAKKNHGPRKSSSAPTVSLSLEKPIDRRPRAAAQSVPSVSLLNAQEQQCADVVAYRLTLKRESLEEAKELIRDAIDKYRHGQRFTEEDLKKIPLHQEFRNNYGDKAYRACLKRIKHACAVIDGHALMVEDIRFIGNTKVKAELHKEFIANHGGAEHETYLEQLKAISIIRRFQILSGNDSAINEAEIDGIIERFNWDLDEAVLLHTLKTSSRKRDELFQKYPGVQQIITECMISKEKQQDPNELCEDLGDSFFNRRRVISSPLYEQQKKNIEAMYPKVEGLDDFAPLAEGLFNKSVRAIASVFTDIEASEKKQRLQMLSSDMIKIQEALKIKKQIHPLKMKLSALNKEKKEVEKLDAKNRTNEFIASVGSILRSVLSLMLPFAPSAEKVEHNHGNKKASRVEAINREIASITIQIQAQEKRDDYVGKSIESLTNLLTDKQEEYRAIISQEATPVVGKDAILDSELSPFVPARQKPEPNPNLKEQKDVIYSICIEGFLAHAYEKSKAEAEAKAQGEIDVKEKSLGTGLTGLAIGLGGPGMKI